MVFNENLENQGTSLGFINKETLLEYVTQEDIFELVFGYYPEEYEFVNSPFREDKRAGCWFERDHKDVLRFKDFTGITETRGKMRVNIDCFDAVRLYFNLPNFYETLSFIKDKLILGKNLEKIKRENIEQKNLKSKTSELIIKPLTRDFLLVDKEFWQDRYSISKENLIEDKVFPIEEYYLKNNKGNFHFYTPDPSYLYTEFKSKNIKIYRPFNEYRFITNCNQNDIGGLHKYSKEKDLLVISKSYKDWRVLTNLNINSMWFQAEGMTPTLETLLPYCFHHKRIVIFFDNDETGIKNSIKLANIINSYFPGKAESLVLPIQMRDENITDPSDLIHKRNLIELLKFCKDSKLI